MIDAHMNQSKPSPNAPTLVSPSHSDERETSQCTPDDNTQRTDICNVCPGSYEPAQECLDDIEMKYHIDANVLGEGHHGSVRQCINRSTGKRHAVKSICKSAPSVNIRGIQREVSLLKSLKHDRILQLDEIYEDSEYVHLVTELCTGGELFDKIVEKSSTGRGCFSEDEAARILCQLLEAVLYLHKNDVVHRDIKPENIMFETSDEDSNIKLIDFGLARKHKQSDAPMSTIVGTPYYLAPCVLNKSYDRSVDLWSVGVIAYILLCGYPPFNGANNKEVYASVQKGLFYFPSAEWGHVSHAAKDFVIRLLQTNPKRRMTAEQALAHPWIRHFHLDRISSNKAAEHEAIHVINEDSESCNSFVEVVLDGAVSLHNENIVCGMHC